MVLHCYTVLVPYAHAVYVIIRTLKSGSLLIDSSTIDPSVAIEISKKVAEKASVFMDAPVSGGLYCEYQA